MLERLGGWECRVGIPSRRVLAAYLAYIELWVRSVLVVVVVVVAVPAHPEITRAMAAPRASRVSWFFIRLIRMKYRAWLRLSPGVSRSERGRAAKALSPDQACRHPAGPGVLLKMRADLREFLLAYAFHVSKVVGGLERPRVDDALGENGADTGDA